MKNLNYYSRNRGSLAALQSNDVGYDCRLTVGSPSGRYSSGLLKLVTVLVLILTIGVGSAWGTTYTYTPGGTYSASGGTSTISGVQWTYSSATYCSLNSSKIQIGSKNNPQTSNWTIQTAISNFGSGKKVTAISLTAYTTATSATYDISAGGSSVKSGSLTTSSNTYTASSLNVTSGNIVITMKGSSTSKAMYLCGISVTYEDAGATYTYSFNNGGHGTAPSGGTAASVSLSAITGVTGYTCTGWTANYTVKVGGSNVSSGTLISNGSTATLTANSTVFTAQWENASYSITKTLTHCSSSPAIPSSYTYTGSAAGLSYTITADDGYELPSSITVSGTTYTWDKATGALSLTGTISGNVSITISAGQLYTVSFDKGTGTCATTSLQGTNADGVTLPTPTHHCDGWVFAGWKTTSLVTSETTTAPATLYAGGSTYKPSSNITLYAVYKKPNASTTDFMKGSKSDLTANNQVLIVNPGNKCVMKSTSSTTGKLDTLKVSMSASGDIITPWHQNNIFWTVGVSSTKFTFKSGSNYLRSTGNNALECGGTSDTWSVTANGTSYIFLSTNSSKDLEYYSGKFTTYNTGTNAAYLMDIYVPADIYYSNPSCCTALGSINGSVSWSNDGTSLTVKNWGYTQGTGAAESNISKYTVYLYSDADSYAASIGNADCTVANRASTGVTFDDLDYARTYKVKITATPASNYCPIDDVWSTDTYKLTCATPTAATAGSFASATQKMPITWTSGAGKVDICYSSNSSTPGATPGSGYTVVSNQTSSPVNLDVSGLAAGNYYCWVRSVCDASNKSAWTAITGNTFTIPAHTLTITKDGGGSSTITPASGSSVVEGRTASIEATPATGFAFDHWAVSGTNASLSSTSTNPTTFTMGTANATVTGYFTCVEPVIVTPPADADYYVGDSPTPLSVTATLASGTLTYLWKVSTNGGSTWSDAEGTNNAATYSGASLSTASAGTIKFKCIVGNSQGGCSVESGVATITVANASYFPNGATVFIQAESSSAWDASACVKAWFNASGAGGAAQTTYWLFDATGNKKIYAAVVPADGDLNQVTLQRFASNCSDFYNANGTLTQASSGGSNIFCSNGSGNSNVAWNGTALTMSLMSSDAWLTPVATLTDQGSGVWSGTYEYTPSNTSTEYIVATNYNGNIGNTGNNSNATLSGMIVGSTYNVTATLNVIAHSLVMGKTFVKGTVHFDLQGHGLAIADLTDVTNGSKISAPSEPSESYYTFGGWFKEPACTNEWNFATDEVSETMTLYAKWTVIPVTAITLNHNSLKKYVGESSVTLSVTSVTPATADPSVNWSTSNPSIADVTSGGVVTFVAAGTATITATSTVSGSVTATCAVEVRSISGPTMQDEDGTLITGGEGKPSATWTLGTRTLTASEGASKYKFKRWIVTNATPGSTTNLSTTLGDPTGNVTVVAEFYKPITVTWKVGNGAASGGTTEVKYNTKVASLPTPPADNALASCGTGANTFMGWTAGDKIEETGHSAPGDLFTTVGGAGCVALTTNTTYRAVFATQSGGNSTITLTNSQIQSGRNGTNNYSTAYNIEGWTGKYAVPLANSKYSLQIGRNTDSSRGAYNSHITTPTLPAGATITSIKLTPHTSWTTASGRTFYLMSVDDLGYTAASDQSNDYGVGSCASDNGVVTINTTNSPTQCHIYADGTAYLDSISLTYSSLSIKDYITGCCTPLGAIGGAVEYTNPTTAVLTWNKMSNVDAETPYTITYRTGEAAYGSSNVGAVDLSGAKATCTITNLACNTPYDFKIAVTAAEDYCSKDSVMTATSPKYSITKGVATGGTFTTKISTDAVTEACNGATIAIAATPSAGYTFSSWTITNDDNSGANVTSTLLGGSSTTASTSFTMPSYSVTVTANFSCITPNHIDITGNWDRFGGETISLTATAYATAGTESPIAAADITGYQWQKWYNDQWNNMSDAGNISGTNTNNLVITNCTGNNSGSYQCAITTGAGCSPATQDIEVKVFTLECYTGGEATYNFTRDGENQRGSVEITLAANTAYAFKVHADNVYYGNNGTVNEDVTDWECSTSEGNLTVNSGLGGTFTFTMDYSSGGSSSTVGIPELSITYPRKTIYLTPGVWNTGDAKFAIYYFRKEGGTIYGEGFTDFITAGDCGSITEIPQWNGVQINAVRLNSNTTTEELTNPASHYAAAWAKKWNQTSDITINSNDNVVIDGWGPENGDSPYTYGTYTIPTYTISYAAGSDTYTSGNAIIGSKASETKTCGVDFTLPNAAVFTTTGYTQTGWATSDGGSQAYAFGGTYSTNAAQAFYPAWTANTHSLSWSANGGDALTGDYTTGTVAYGTTIVAPDTPTKTGYTFDGWHNGTGVVTPATTMPDNDLSYTAQWSLASYSVTLTTNGGTINAGNVTSYTYGTGATLPTNVTRDGYRFDGWFSDDGVWEHQVTAISTTDTGNKIYYAKWTAVHTVTWSVNGETWSSGVVDGNTYVVDGQRVSVLPTAPTKSDCDDSKVFVGWKALAIDGSSPGNPGGIFTTKEASPAITQDTTFYAVFADVSGGDEIEFKLPFDNKSECGVNNYTSSWVAEIDDYSWTISNFNNNKFSNGWTSDIRCGRDGNASIASITTDAAISFRVDSVYINLTATNDSYINSAKLQISSSSGISTPDEINIPVNTTGVKGLKITSPAKDKYYRVIFDCKSYTTNGFVRIGSIVYKQKLDTANYVTTCASCDADATFTNEAPAVSDIDCTGATLTMEDGLETLGSEGCNVTDYGFVIGTADNPAIGGSGVTKLQVGTSNPTTGADFSYDATGLTKGTHYYIRAYATNRHGTAYSSSTNFWTNNVSSIVITTAPTKTNYIVGETFDATGMVVTATMADSNTEDVTSDVTYSTSALTAGANQDFAINYTLCETEKNANQKINVYTLTVTEGTNPEYGTATNSSANIVSITGLGDHKTYTVTVTSDNADVVDNGDNTWSVINPTGNVTVRVDYANAEQVKVYYKVDGVTVTGLTQDVYQSETTTLPTASQLATAMTAQGMEMPDDTYPNFIGWSETEFPAQTAEPSLVTGTPTINAEKTYYAVYTNMGQIHLDAYNLVSTYPSTERTVNVGSKDFKYHYLGDANISGTHVMQFKRDASEYGYIYNNDALSNILRIEIGHYNSDSHVPVYAASAAGTITGDALTPASRETTDPYVYTFPESTAYFMIKGDNSTTYKISSIDIYYTASTVYYMTQFCTRYGITGASTSGTDVIVDSYTAGRLTSNYNSACEGKSIQLEAHVNSGYQFGTWTIKKTDDPTQDVTSTLLPGDNASSLTPDAFLMPAYAITVSATITEKEVTGWTWKQELADASEIDIPATVQLYVGQQAWFNLKAYEPADVLNKKKGYYDNYTNTDLAQDGKGNVTYKTRAKIVKESTTLTFTSTNEEVQKVINIQIKALPLVHFVDLIHGETFADVVANVDESEKRTVYTTKPTPTHAADVGDPGASYNSCERQHLHLIGWIESEWAEAHPNAEPGEITSAGAGNYYAAGANIDLATQDGKTFYAVWSKIE